MMCLCSSLQLISPALSLGLPSSCASNRSGIRPFASQAENKERLLRRYHGLRLAKQQPPAVCHGVAPLFVSARALAGEQAHNTEASCPDWANPPPTPAAILARSVRPVGPPSSLYGAHIRRASISVDSLQGTYSFPMHNPRAFFATWDVRHSCQPPRRHGSRGTGKIGSRAIGCKPCSRNQRSNGGCLPRPEFHHEEAPRRKQAPRLRDDGPISVEAVQPAVERDARIECAHLGLKNPDLAARSIGRVGHHEVDGSLERCSILASDERRAHAMRGGIATGTIQCRRAYVGANSPRFPQFGQQR